MDRNLQVCICGLFFICLLSIGGRLNAQDPVFSQFYASPLNLNPAFAGNTYAPHIALNYRNQWSSIFNAYVTYAVSYDQYFENLKSGLGVSIMMDRAGDGVYNTGAFNLTYAYRLPITEDINLKGGVQVGIHQVSLDWDKLVFLDQLDPIDGQTQISEENRPEILSKSSFNASAGLLFYSRMFYAGVSAFHINTPDESLLEINESLLEGLPMRLSFHGGAQFSLTKDNKSRFPAFISPNLMYTKQKSFQQLNLGTYVGLGPIFGGVWFRHTFANSDAAIFLIGFNKGIFKIGYSYDWTVSGLQTESNGSHEVSVILNFDAGRKRPPDYNDCLKIFR